MQKLVTWTLQCLDLQIAQQLPVNVSLSLVPGYSVYIFIVPLPTLIQKMLFDVETLYQV